MSGFKRYGHSVGANAPSSSTTSDAHLYVSTTGPSAITVDKRYKYKESKPKEHKHKEHKEHKHKEHKEHKPGFFDKFMEGIRENPKPKTIEDQVNSPSHHHHHTHHHSSTKISPHDTGFRKTGQEVRPGSSAGGGSGSSSTKVVVTHYQTTTHTPSHHHVSNFCSNCGSRVQSTNANFCTSCGRRV